MQKNAEAIGFDLSDDEDDREGDARWETSKKDTKVKSLRAELKYMLDQPLMKSRKMPVMKTKKVSKSSKIYAQKKQKNA